MQISRNNNDKGDFNALVEKGRFEDIVGPYGLGERNFRGERVISWCDTSGLFLTNTWFDKHPRLLWTWKSPGDRCRNQIDYIQINKRFRNAVLDARTYPGADYYTEEIDQKKNGRKKATKTPNNRPTTKRSIQS